MDAAVVGITLTADIGSRSVVLRLLTVQAIPGSLANEAKRLTALL